MTEELKPCPLCGGKAELWRAQEGRSAFIGCMGDCMTLVSGEKKTDEEIVAVWNTRAAPPDPDAQALAEALRGFPVTCLVCGGDGKETCENPDHGFLAAIGGDYGRIGCPGCGHDPHHKVKGGGKCDLCDGSGKITAKVALEFEDWDQRASHFCEPHEMVALRALHTHETGSLLLASGGLTGEGGDGWTKHDGGKRPVGADVRVQVRLRGGAVCGAVPADVPVWDWSRVPKAGQVVEYRLAPSPEAPDPQSPRGRFVQEDDGA